jgi:hypothetical protein
MPMLVQLSGMQEWPGFQGRSPFGGHRGSPVFMTVNGLTRENDVVQWPWKLMSRTFPERSVELFNLQDDPEERHDVSRDQPEVAGKLVDALTNWRTCQLSYYADRNAYTTLQPPRY